MLKLKNTAMFLVAALCGYLALMTPDWKAELIAQSGTSYQTDVDNDNDDDLIQINGNGQVKVYEIQNSASLGAAIDATITIAAYNIPTDCDADGDLDYYTQTAAGARELHVMQSRALTGSNALLFTSTAYLPVGAGDVDADGDDDIVLYRESDGRTLVYEVENCSSANTGGNGTTWVGDFLQTSYRPVGLGDVDDDGDDDLWWVRYNLDNFESVVVWWFANASRAPATDVDWLNAYYNNNYKIRAIGDFDGDGDDDLVWKNLADGNVVAWEIQDPDASHSGTRPQRVTNQWVGTFFNTAWDIVESGDTNGDGVEDLIWYNASNGGTNAWEIWALTSNGNKPSILASSNTAFAPMEKDDTRKYD